MPIFSHSELESAQELFELARGNGEDGVRIINEEEARQLEPNLEVGSESGKIQL